MYLHVEEEKELSETVNRYESVKEERETRRRERERERKERERWKWRVVRKDAIVRMKGRQV